MRGRAVVLGVLVVLAAGCGVRPMEARVAGVGPDTHPAALAQASEEARAAGEDEAPFEVAPPRLEAADRGRITVALRDEAGVRFVERPAVVRSDEPIVDAIVALREPLTEAERAAGLRTEVPVDTEVRDVHVRRDSVLVDLTGGFGRGGTEAELWRRTQQVACTALEAIGAAPGRVVDVSLEGAFVGRFGRFGDEVDQASPC